MDWKVTSLQVEDQGDLKDVAVFASFTVSSSGESVSYSVNLLPADPKTFAPYAGVTADMAAEWVKSSLGSDRVAAMEAEVQAKIDANAAPQPESKPLPWVKTA